MTGNKFMDECPQEMGHRWPLRYTLSTRAHPQPDIFYLFNILPVSFAAFPDMKTAFGLFPSGRDARPRAKRTPPTAGSCHLLTESCESSK